MGMEMVAENTHYKHGDYDFRSSDPYALSKYQIILRWLPARPNLRILNAGCGSGEMNVLLATRDASWHIDAIDIDPQAIARSQRLKEQYGLANLHIAQTPIEAHQPAAPYDVIISNDVLEHIEDDTAAMRALVAVLAPGGEVFISVPALMALFGHHDTMLGHYRRYNMAMFRAHFGGLLEIRRLRYFGGLLIPIAFYFSRLRRTDYPLDGQRDPNSLSARIVGAVLAFERAVALPLGTSLIARGTARR